MDKLKKFEEIVGLLDKDQPSTQEVAEALEAILNVVATLKDHLLDKIGDVDASSQKRTTDVLSEMETLEERLNDIFTTGDNLTKKECREASKKLQSEITRLEALIPLETDLSEVEARLNKLENKKEVTVEDIEKDLPKFGTAFRDGLELLQGEERLDAKAIKGLEEELAELKTLIANIPRGGGGGGSRGLRPYRDDFSALTDGSTRTFYLSRAPMQNETVMVFGTDFPTILRPTIDFTVAGKAVTLTSAVPAPSQGATLLITYFS